MLEERVRFTEGEAVANLRTVLELCAAGEIKCGRKTGLPLASGIHVVETHLANGDFYEDDPIAAFAWPLLLQAGGLARVEGIQLQLTPSGQAALTEPAADVIRGLWQSWLTDGVIDEFSRIEEIQGPEQALTDATPRRKVVAAALATCRLGKWVDVDALFERMQRDGLDPTIALNYKLVGDLYLVDPYYGGLGDDDWELLEGRYTLAVLFEYAATLGLIDVDYVHPDGAREDYRDNWGGDDLDALSRYDGLVAISLNALGAYVLGLSDTYEWPLTSHNR
ncbi:hypothetical protein [Actinokineospora globicatena]|uniref:hypothetical protein n=1 Tax=Actinokineospora globicatena TaxID=103729 RepID=UPI0020A50024|nr:hypothetical protein [Actinokineospora globicatena]MCP2304583.1 pentatricopeptide repeat domain-containing protein (PPR motif) [Actinokineospora globicatena]GLW78046.1 hypothetical protein Aglo01_25280 [Actinokineospora globicatena]GLW85288.1 hypothetical protein Aglo02_29280 [Actinokineospora globicatena]